MTGGGPALGPAALRRGSRVPAIADPAGWHLHFGRELNATEDRPHFTERGDLPIVEGKQLRPFGVDAAAPRFWIRRETAATLLDRPATFGRARLAYRDVASPTNRQTLIAAIVPRDMVTTHTVFCVKEPLEDEAQRLNTPSKVGGADLDWSRRVYLGRVTHKRNVSGDRRVGRALPPIPGRVR